MKERELEEYIVDNFDELMPIPGVELIGRQVAVRGGIIDLLAQHTQSSRLDIIELKVVKPDGKVVGQMMRYRAGLLAWLLDCGFIELRAGFWELAPWFDQFYDEPHNLAIQSHITLSLVVPSIDPTMLMTCAYSGINVYEYTQRDDCLCFEWVNDRLRNEDAILTTESVQIPNARSIPAIDRWEFRPWIQANGTGNFWHD